MVLKKNEYTVGSLELSKRFMMEKTVMYLVVSFGGQWDDAWHKNEWSTLDMKKAEQHIVKLRVEQDLNNSVCDKIQEFINDHHDRVGPCPSVGGFQDYPRWTAGMANSAITIAMRSERDYIIANNARIQEENNVLAKSYIADREKEIVEFLLSLGHKEDDLIMKPHGRHIRRADFRIEEVPFGG